MQVVSYGAGTNSTAMLIEMVRRKEPCNLITFADTGGERPRTYAYLKYFSKYLVSRGYPKIITLKKDSIYSSLEDNCLKKNMLPSLAYGFKSCSDKYKIQPQNKFMNNYFPAQEIWSRGLKIVKCIGYDADEERRARIFNDEKYIYRYPLIEWEMGREECIESIKAAKLRLPGKSACFFCPATKKQEILDLKKDYPELLQRALTMEANAMLTSVKGLGRSFSWREFIESGEHDKISCSSDIPCGCYDG